MEFELTEEQQDFRDLAHDFALNEMRPVAAEHDREGTWPGNVLAKAWELGLMNTRIDPEYGGAGLGLLSTCIIGEELAWGCPGITTCMGGNELALTPLAIGGSDELKRRYLTRLTEAPRFASFCLTEPGAGSDAASLRTTAVRRGDGYVINGSKCFITNGSHADWYSVFAKTDPAAGHRGISAFVVPREAGVIVDRVEDKMGHRASDTAALSFNDVEVPADHLIGVEGQGFSLAMETVDRTRPGVAAWATGIGRAAVELTSAYVNDRVQFGVPIANHQGIQFMVADMATDVEASRMLTWRSAWLVDQGKGSSVASAHAKRFAAEAAMRVTTTAVQLHGGYGYLRTCPAEKLMRDAKLMAIYEGTDQMQKLVIARDTLSTSPEAVASRR
ncbi:MAG: acyl-CoA dehydrogenase family protein [Solirubrobacterales bacterium]|nr:acyl-CoA dehydrogenase family protein [Solirubrobacterales bacterium]